MTKSTIDSYWNQFLDSLPSAVLRPRRYYEAFHFGTTAESAAELAALVLMGVKTATGSLLWVYEAEKKPIPQAGDLSIVTDGDGLPRCIIETTKVLVLPFNEADEKLAFDGGEGDKSLEYWRGIYWSYIVSECARIGRRPAPDTPLVCEWFRVVYRAPLSLRPPDP